MKFKIKMSEKIFEKGLLNISVEIDGWQIKIKEVYETVRHQFYSSVMLILIGMGYDDYNLLEIPLYLNCKLVIHLPKANSANEKVF